MQRLLRTFGWIALLSSAAYGQVAAHGFEVASVKPNLSGSRTASLEFAKGGVRLTAVNVPLGALLLTAYDITVRQLSGATELLSERYDVVAKAEHSVNAGEMRRMLQVLMADRFKLVVRRERREAPVYSLSVAKGGPKLTRSELPDDAVESPRNPFGAVGAEPKSGHLVFRNESMSDFAWALSRTAGLGDRVVVDHTGVEGRYDFELSFERSRPAEAVTPEEATLREEPAIFSALQQQLGLKLEPAREPVEFVVIEHIQRPTAN